MPLRVFLAGMLTKVKNFTLFDDSVNGATMEDQRKALPHEAAADRCHTWLYVLTVLLLAGALVTVQFLATSSVAVGRVTVTNVGYSTFLSGLPADAVCTPAVPLVSYNAFAAFPITQMQLCRGAPGFAQSCAATPSCNNYQDSYPAPLGAIGKASSTILTALCSSAATSTASALTDVLLKTAFTPTVASAGTLQTLLSADSVALLSKVRGQTAAVLEGRRLFDSIERPITSVGLSMSSNHFGYVPNAMNGAVPLDQDFGFEVPILTDAYYGFRSYGSCQWNNGPSASVVVPFTYAANRNANLDLIMQLAIQPGCVPWWLSPPDSSGNAQIMSRSTTCTASTSEACAANSECKWIPATAPAFPTGGYCESQYCSLIPRSRCTRNPRCQLSARGVCEGKPLQCSNFKSQASCHTSLLCTWADLSTGSRCAWTDYEVGPASGREGSMMFKAVAALISSMGSSSPSPPRALDFPRMGSPTSNYPAFGLLSDPYFVAGGNIPFLQGREDGLFARSSILQANFDGRPGVSTLYGNTGPCDCYRDYSCVVPDSFPLDTSSGPVTINYNKSCTLYNTIMSLPLNTWEITIPGSNYDLFGSISPSMLRSTYGIHTLEDAFRQAFILNAAPTVNHQAYYDAVGPVSCTYTANLATTPLQAITTVRFPNQLSRLAHPIPLYRATQTFTPILTDPWHHWRSAGPHCKVHWHSGGVSH